MLVLGIETTCDETAAAVVHRDGQGQGSIRSNIIHSQLDEHRNYGGVVPEIAARAHVELLDGVIRRAMEQAGVSYTQLDAVAAAAGPGLIGGVIVGLTTAKSIALVAGKPLIAVNHLEAHALTVRLTHRLGFPFLLLLVSGGHTQLISVEDIGRYRFIGGTIDDAIGEAFDKTAKMLGLPYPGGPEVERCAADRRSDPVQPASADARPAGAEFLALRIEDGSTDRSRARRRRLPTKALRIFARVFRRQSSMSSSIGFVLLLQDCETARGNRRALVVAGGVGANRTIRGALEAVSAELAMPLMLPPPELCTDNGAMIAWAGAERLARGLVDGLETSPRARWPLGEVAAPT